MDWKEQALASCCIAAVSGFTCPVEAEDATQKLKADRFKLLEVRGFTKMSKGDLDGAADEFTQVIKGHPEAKQPYYNRALVYVRQKKLDKAVADLDQALKIDPKYQFALITRGMVKMDQEKLDEASQDLTQAIEVNSSKSMTAMAYTDRGSVRLKQKQFEGAIEDCNKALELDPKSKRALQIRAEAKDALEKGGTSK